METAIDLAIKPITGHVGAIIEGVDLRRTSSGLVKSIRQAILDHGVVFFRGQDQLTLEELATFVSQFGALQPDFFQGRDAPLSTAAREFDIAPVRDGTALWHSDFTFFHEPPVFTGLRSVRLPPVGGDTCWASLYAAYDALSEPIRRSLDGLTAVHTMERTSASVPSLVDRYAVARAVYGDNAEHPVVITHPETGRKALYVFEANTMRINGVSALESRHLLNMLFEHLRSPLFSMRWTWKPHDVALWDNRALQHYATPDYEGERVMQNVRTVGERPVAG